MEELKLLLALTPEHRAKISERIPPESKAKNRGESQAVHQGLKEFRGSGKDTLPRHPGRGDDTGVILSFG